MGNFDDIVKEHDDLVDRHQKLYDFISSDEFKKLDSKLRNILILQLTSMNTYIIVLQQRIDLGK